MMPASKFEEIWVPRIGREATAQMRRTAYFTMLTVLVVMGFAIAASFSFGRGTAAGGVLGVVEIDIA